MQRRWVSPGVGSDRSRAALLLHPGEGSQASKTGEYDETVIVDDPMLARALAKLKPMRAPGEPLIDGDPAEFWALFSVAVARPKIDKTLGHQVPYVLRHSGDRCLEQALGPHRHTKPGAVDIGKQRVAIREGRGRVAHQLSLCSAPLV